MLALKIGPQPLYPTWLSRMLLREIDLWPIAPEHQNVSFFRTEEPAKAQEFAARLIGCKIIRGHVGIEQPNPHSVAIAGAQPVRKSTQVPGDAFVRIKAKHPIELQLGTSALQQKPSMSAFSNPARRNILFPQSVCHDQSDLRVTAENFQSPICACVVICDYRIDMLANVFQGVRQN